jgi:hypothetical protein
MISLEVLILMILKILYYAGWELNRMLIKKRYAIMIFYHCYLRKDNL